MGNSSSKNQNGTASGDQPISNSPEKDDTTSENNADRKDKPTISAPTLKRSPCLTSDQLPPYQDLPPPYVIQPYVYQAVVPEVVVGDVRDADNSYGSLTLLPHAFDESAASDSEDEDDQSNMKGKPLQLFTCCDDGRKPELDLEVLRTVFLSEEVVQRRVAIYSVAGAKNTGKSFLLNFMLRYLNSAPKEKRWLDDKEKGLTGFKSKGSSARCTSGIWIWSEPFIRRAPDGNEVAVFLVDTQGSFDASDAMQNMCDVFTLTAMLSSWLIYNVPHGSIGSNDLNYFHLFAESARMEMGSSGHNTGSAVKPFQKLTFLVRDWIYTAEHPYGWDGGAAYLEQIWTNIAQNPDFRGLRKNLESIFGKIDCFNMPDPGRKISHWQRGTASLRDVDRDFERELDELVPRLFDAIEPRKLNECTQTGSDYFICIQQFAKTIANSDPMASISFTDSYGIATHAQALRAALLLYYDRMAERHETGNLEEVLSNLEELNEPARQEAIAHFHATPRMFAEFHEKEYLAKLNTGMDEFYETLQYAAATNTPFLQSLFIDKVERKRTLEGLAIGTLGAAGGAAVAFLATGGLGGGAAAGGSAAAVAAGGAGGAVAMSEVVAGVVVGAGAIGGATAAALVAAPIVVAGIAAFVTYKLMDFDHKPKTKRTGVPEDLLGELRKRAAANGREKHDK